MVFLPGTGARVRTHSSRSLSHRGNLSRDAIGRTSEDEGRRKRRGTAEPPGSSSRRPEGRPSSGPVDRTQQDRTGRHRTRNSTGRDGRGRRCRRS
ncbi:hypothetical protein KTR9_5154 (plasmid) [Gordonia sp. KTR9]|nr:hypothetical protein KTR9_5154 [Gordonia sp. KTR9]